jgi:hypothetical protein
MIVKISDGQIYLLSSVRHNYVSSYQEYVHSNEVVTVLEGKTTMNSVYREPVLLALIPRSTKIS